MSGSFTNVLPSKDAVDDQFQHTLDMLAGIRMRWLNLQACELLIDMLNVSNVNANDIRSGFISI